MLFLPFPVKFVIKTFFRAIQRQPASTVEVPFKEIVRAQTCDGSSVHYSPLINRAGDLFGRVLTKVVKYRPNEVSPVNKMFIMAKRENFNSCNVNGSYQVTICLRTTMS